MVSVTPRPRSERRWEASSRRLLGTVLCLIQSLTKNLKGTNERHKPTPVAGHVMAGRLPWVGAAIYAFARPGNFNIALGDCGLALSPPWVIYLRFAAPHDISGLVSPA